MEQKKSRPKVSVCVTAYNKVKFIKDCLLSALAQSSDTDIEILVGDDASTDGTSEIIQRLADAYPDLIKYFRHDTKLGYSLNNQFLVKRAAGDFIAYLDGDDVWFPGKLEAQLEFLMAHPECSAVFTNAVIINTEQELLGLFSNDQPELQDINYLVRRGNYLPFSSLVYHARFKESILSIDCDWIDYNVFCRLAMGGVLGYLNKVFTVYRDGNVESLSKKSWGWTEAMVWEALEDVKGSAVAANALLEGFSYFWGHILFLSLRYGCFSSVVYWAKRICREKGMASVIIFPLGILFFIGTLLGKISDQTIAKITRNPIWIRGRR